DRLTTLARRRSRLRPSDRLHLVRGRPRPRRVSRPDRGDDGGRLPHAGGPAGPKARGGPTPLRIRLVGTPPGVVRTPRQPRAAQRPRPPGHQLGAERGGLAHVGLLRRRVPGGRVGAVPCDRRAPPPPGQRAGPGGLQLVPVLPSPATTRSGSARSTDERRRPTTDGRRSTAIIWPPRSFLDGSGRPKTSRPTEATQVRGPSGRYAMPSISTRNSGRASRASI